MNKNQCQHPSCNKYSKYGICDGHINLIQNDENSVVLCINCGRLVAVIVREQFLSLKKSNTLLKAKKYYWCHSCPNCCPQEYDKKVLVEE